MQFSQLSYVHVFHFYPGTVYSGSIRISATAPELAQINMLKMLDNFQKPTELEMEILVRLLSVNFPSVDRLRERLHGLLVKNINDDGCMALKVRAFHNPSTEYGHCLPVEAGYVTTGNWDVYEPKAHILLHVDSNDCLRELEFYNDEPCEFRQPELNALHLEVNETIECE
jgi:hypothetical protein